MNRSRALCWVDRKLRRISLARPDLTDSLHPPHARRKSCLVLAIGLSLTVASCSHGSSVARTTSPSFDVSGSTPATPQGLIVYQCESPTGNTCVVGGDGSNPRSVNVGGIGSLSPNGLYIASSRPRCGSQCDLGGVFVGSSTGSHTTMIWQYGGTGVCAPAWSSNGQLAVVIGPTSTSGPPPTQQTPTGLWVLGTDRSAAFHINANASCPVAWSPDGSKIAFLGHAGAIDVISSSGSTPVKVAQSLASDPSKTWLSWSPDGTTLLLTQANVVNPTGNSGVGGSSDVVAINLSSDTQSPVLGFNPKVDYFGAFYSPSGKQIAVLASCRAGGRTNSGIVIMNREATSFHLVDSRLTSISICGSFTSSTAGNFYSPLQVLGWVG